MDYQLFLMLSKSLWQQVRIVNTYCGDFQFQRSKTRLKKQERKCGRDFLTLKDGWMRKA